nr:hypothetical protein [Tanacetum cinerariifolium]
MFGKLSDDDAIRLRLLLAVELIFMGRLLTFKNLKQRHSDEHYYMLKKDRNYVPTYTLSGFVFAFQIWILETLERCESWWIKDPKVIPRALGWSKKSLSTRSDYSYLFAKDYLREEELRLCLEDEEMLRCEHEKLIVKENRFRLDESNRLRIDDSSESYSLFEANYNGMFHELPLRYECGKVLPLKLFKSKRMSYSQMLDMIVYKLKCEIRGFDWIDEPVGFDDRSLPGKSKDEFSNEVILDDVVSSPATTLSLLLKRKGKSMIKFTRMRAIVKSTADETSKNMLSSYYCDKDIIELRWKFKKAKKERDDLKLTLEKFKGDDKYNSSEGYHAVPPPYTEKYMPPKPDLVFTDEHVVSESVTSLPGIAKRKVKTSESKLKTVSDLIIEEWVLDDKEEDVSQPKIEKKIAKPSFVKINYIKANKTHKNAKKNVEQIAETRRFINIIREEAQTARNCIAQLNALVAEIEDMGDANDVFDTLMCIRDDILDETTKLMGLNDAIAQAEDKTATKEGHVYAG